MNNYEAFYQYNLVTLEKQWTEYLMDTCTDQNFLETNTKENFREFVEAQFDNMEEL